MNNNNLRISYQGSETNLCWEELRIILNNSNLPWFKEESNIFVMGYETDIDLRVTVNDKIYPTQL